MTTHRGFAARPDRDGARAWRSPDAVAIAGLLVVVIVLPLLLEAMSGTVDVPRNDDWSYRGIARRLFETGRLELDGAAQTIVIGQILLTQPFLWLTRGGALAFLLVGTIASGIAVAAGYALVRRFLDRGSALFAVGTLLVVPGYLAYAVSFMSDVPALACQFGCLGLGTVALERREVRWRWLVAALVVGGIGFTIREFALAAPAAVLAVLLLRDPGSRRAWLAVLAVAVTAAFVLLWRSGLGGQLGSVPWSIGPLWRVLEPIVSLSLALGPVTIVAARRWWPFVSRRGLLLGSLAGELIAVAVAVNGPFPSVTVFGLLTPWGAPHPFSLMGDRPVLIPEPFWSVLAVAALASTVLLCSLVGGIVDAQIQASGGRPTGLRSKLMATPGVLAVFVAIVAAGLGVFSLVGSFYDRYLWPAIPVLAALLLYVPRAMPRVARRTMPEAVPRIAQGAAIAGALALVTVAGAVMLNSYAYDGARWHAGESLVAMGYRPETVDAGAEWVHAHQRGIASVTRPGEGIMWYQRQWPDLVICAFAADSDPGFAGEFLIAVVPDAYRLGLIAGPAEPLYLYGVTRTGCPS